MPGRYHRDIQYNYIIFVNGDLIFAQDNYDTGEKREEKESNYFIHSEKSFRCNFENHDVKHDLNDAINHCTPESIQLYFIHPDPLHASRLGSFCSRIAIFKYQTF